MVNTINGDTMYFLFSNFLTEPIDWSKLLNSFLSWFITIGIKLTIGFIVMSVLFKIINVISKNLYKKLKNKNVEETISRVVVKTIKFLFKSIVLLCFIGYVGIETASITALITSGGVALGLALQGALSNVAGGIIIILMRPFRIGDYIYTNGESGTVENIHMFYTTLVTPDNRVIQVPNGNLANNVIINNSTKEKRRVDIIMTVSYNSDFEQIKSIIFNVCNKNELIDKTPEPFVSVNDYVESGVDLNIRVWTNTSDYWTIHRYLLHEIRKEFVKNNVEIPFNQLDVHIKNE